MGVERERDEEEHGERDKEEREERKYNQGQASSCYDRFEDSMMLLFTIYNLELMCVINLVRNFKNYCHFFESLIELFKDYQG